MTTYFVTRHQGALEWAQRRGLEADEMLPHFDPDVIRPGDAVIGTLPVHVAAQICARGGRYMHLILNTPPQSRGKELTADDMERFGARLEEYEIHPAHIEK